MGKFLVVVHDCGLSIYENLQQKISSQISLLFIFIFNFNFFLFATSLPIWMMNASTVPQFCQSSF